MLCCWLSAGDDRRGRRSREETQSKGLRCGLLAMNGCTSLIILVTPASSVQWLMSAALLGLWVWALWLLEVSDVAAQFCSSFSLWDVCLDVPVLAGDFAFLC